MRTSTEAAIVNSADQQVSDYTSEHTQDSDRPARELPELKLTLKQPITVILNGSKKCQQGDPSIGIS